MSLRNLSIINKREGIYAGKRPDGARYLQDETEVTQQVLCAVRDYLYHRIPKGRNSFSYVWRHSHVPSKIILTLSVERFPLPQEADSKAIGWYTAADGVAHCGKCGRPINPHTYLCCPYCGTTIAKEAREDRG